MRNEKRPAIKASNRDVDESFKDFAARILEYSPATGLFTWKEDRNGNCMKGRVAGTPDKDGYVSIRVDGRIIRAHRLAFYFMTDAEPPSIVDHINGLKADNRWVNLRAADALLNAQNVKKANKRSTTGLLGVSKSDGRFRAIIKADKKTYCIGSYGTPEEAHEAYLAAKRELHKGCTI